MQFQQLWFRVGVPIAGAALVLLAWQKYGWQGVAVVATGFVMWALMHVNRIMTVLKRAADQPIGYVGSAVMLNAKLRPGVNLLHVVAMTKSLGEQRSPPDQQPETYRWTDPSHSHVDCVFNDGRLVRWEMVRPPTPAGPGMATVDPALPPDIDRPNQTPI